MRGPFGPLIYFSYIHNMNLGYACINTGLSANKIMTNRTMRRKTLDEKGIDYVSDLALANANVLKLLQFSSP